VRIIGLSVPFSLQGFQIGLPELMSMFKQVADIRTADTLKLDVPDCDYQVVQVEATPFQQELVQELADRADAINSGNVDPTIDNMLKITSDGRKFGLDQQAVLALILLSFLILQSSDRSAFYHNLFSSFSL